MTVADAGLWTRVQGRYQRTVASALFKRPFTIRTPTPFVSFTFDDFPSSALTAGGAILNRHGLRGTYYASLGLMGTNMPSGPMFVPEDLRTLIAQRHELGCHTYDHCHSWDTPTRVFASSIAKNLVTLHQLVPTGRFRTFSYPKSPPRPLTKRRTSEWFACCRGGGQTLNVGTADLNYLKAYFLEKARHDPAPVLDLIDRNRGERGWLILATHDVSPDPSPFGVTPEFFEKIVDAAVASGATILPVIHAYDALRTIA